MSDNLIGKSLDGRYELEEVLGTGATGSVYRATQTAVDRVVAIKTLHPFLQEKEDFKARFEIEAKAIARLNHPNCITLYDFGYDESLDVFYMAVEFINGTSLADMMAEAIPYEDVMSIGYQITEALQQAHREGILHRDLKPENIMVRRAENSGRPIVKVLDFGLARLYESETEEDEGSPSGRYKHLTQAGQVYGTPAYMSPEQCRSIKELTAATDLYALGTMMYELFEGHLPFFSQSTAELMMMQMTEDPPRMERRDVPGPVKDIIFRMMQKDPEARPQSAKEVLLTLLPHVRLDASQEMRIMPSESGEFQLQVDGERVGRTSTPPPALRESRPPTPTLLSDPHTLSSDELKAATSSNKLLLTVGAIALVVGIFGMMMVASFGDESTSGPKAVDGQPPGVASSPERQPDRDEAAADDEPVEVAEADEDDPEKGRSKRRARTGSARPSAEKSSDSQDQGSKTSGDRAKTLKLTY
jgi:serine/threonine-protein kinase